MLNVEGDPVTIRPIRLNMLKLDWIQRESAKSENKIKDKCPKCSGWIKEASKQEELIQVLSGAPVKVYSTLFVKRLANSVWGKSRTALINYIFTY